MPDHHSDHDLLVKINTIQEIMVRDIKEIKEGTAKDIADLKRDKADKTELNETKQDVADLKKYLYMGIGALTVIQLLVTYYLKNK